MQCPTCEDKALIHPKYGITQCLECQQKQRIKIQNQEITTESIKTQRKQFKDDIIGPFRNGELSKEYVDLYGTDHIEVTPEEVKNAKKVWVEDSYYDN